MSTCTSTRTSSWTFSRTKSGSRSSGSRSSGSCSSGSCSSGSRSSGSRSSGSCSSGSCSSGSCSSCSCSSGSRSSGCRSFLDKLPTEVRLMVYGFLPIQTTYIELFPSMDSYLPSLVLVNRSFPSVAILRVNRQINNEASETIRRKLDLLSKEPLRIIADSAQAMLNPKLVPFLDAASQSSQSPNEDFSEEAVRYLKLLAQSPRHPGSSFLNHSTEPIELALPAPPHFVPASNTSHSYSWSSAHVHALNAMYHAYMTLGERLGDQLLTRPLTARPHVRIRYIAASDEAVDEAQALLGPWSLRSGEVVLVRNNEVVGRDSASRVDRRVLVPFLSIGNGVKDREWEDAWQAGG
ncbi:hypothetical protein BDV95DRAFT_267404 [Massariosphaeria phaeospora]|uniref:Uncharacterized protein n=1 Tax=Massariosphaeria phaeospora TaxID=100035 RepID=A0A7C8HZS9_9PLEO|nr:hypothetical protein BDV95DRAFT_267404 [Massariosphaeria phaeospora]